MSILYKSYVENPHETLTEKFQPENLGYGGRFSMSNRVGIFLSANPFSLFPVCLLKRKTASFAFVGI